MFVFYVFVGKVVIEGLVIGVSVLFGYVNVGIWLIFGNLVIDFIFGSVFVFLVFLVIVFFVLLVVVFYYFGIM